MQILKILLDFEIINIEVEILRYEKMNINIQIKMVGWESKK